MQTCNDSHLSSIYLILVFSSGHQRYFVYADLVLRWVSAGLNPNLEVLAEL